MNAIIPNPMKLGALAGAGLTVAAGVVLMLCMADACQTMDQPPQEPDQQRAWLAGHLVTDMEALGTFDANTLAKVPGVVNALTDDQVALLAQYYFLTRSKTEQDASLYALQQQGDTDEQVNEATAEVADLLTTMNDEIDACYTQFVPMPQPVLYIAQICYASVPGWCCHVCCFVPAWYYDNGCFVGPCHNAARSGPWAAPVWNAYCNHGSHFYTHYHQVANTTCINRSKNLANRNATWLRNHGDWHNTLAHDRLLNQPTNGSYQPPSRLYSSTENHIGNQTPLNHAATNAAPRLAHVGNQNLVVYQPNSEPQSSHISTAHSPDVVHQGAMSHANHASAVDAVQPRPAAYESHAQSNAGHLTAQADLGGHGNHR